MPKGSSNVFGVDVPVLNEHECPMLGPNLKALKEWQHMADAVLADGTLQSLYFSDDHPDEALRGSFK